MGRTESNAPGYVPDDDDQFDPLADDFVAKERRYIHFDYAIPKAERETFTISADEISARSFWPLLGFDKKERRVQKDGKKKLVVRDKTREIKFGSHTDAAILQWYASRLSQRYHELILRRGLGDCILAYRSGVGDNISQARNLFHEIRTLENCTAIGLDIKGFFDNISHEILFQNLVQVVDVDRLPDADFKIFERMTKFECVDVDALKARLKRVKSPKGRLCTSAQFRSVVRRAGNSLIKTNTELFGIPQGTPLSGLYANISMLEFDDKISKYLAKKGGIYRRYSDDIAMIIPEAVNERTVLNYVRAAIRKIRLKINSKKTEISKFCLIGLKLQSDHPFQYLGFTFDGRKTLIRPSSLTRYYSKMKRGVRAKIRAAHSKGIPKEEIYMRELYRRYTHFGKSQNFPRYAYRAAKILKAVEVKSQLRTHMSQFKKCIREEIQAIY